MGKREMALVVLQKSMRARMKWILGRDARRDLGLKIWLRHAGRSPDDQ